MSRTPARPLSALSRSTRQLAVRTVKPLVSEPMWQWLRGPLAVSRELSDLQTALDAKPDAATHAENGEAVRDLTWWARHHRTDKWSKRHRYTPHYERHLGHLREDSFTLLEIGVGGYSRERAGGASLKMWRDYFPNAQVLGLDIADKSFLDGDRLTTYQGSQTDADLLRWISDSWPDLRVVIDDGSHQNAHILSTFDVLFPLLPDGGHYIIEDTQTAFWPRYGGSTDLSDPKTSMGLTKALIDGLNYEEYTEDGYEPTWLEKHVHGVHAYHNLVVIDKGLNAEGRADFSHL